jgi:hypothetical protein
MSVGLCILYSSCAGDIIPFTTLNFSSKLFFASSKSRKCKNVTGEKEPHDIKTKGSLFSSLKKKYTETIVKQYSIIVVTWECFCSKITFLTLNNLNKQTFFEKKLIF